MSATATRPPVNALVTGRLPRWMPWVLLAISWLVSGIAVWIIQAAPDPADYNIVGAILLGTLVFDLAITVISWLLEGGRQARTSLARFCCGTCA